MKRIIIYIFSLSLVCSISDAQINDQLKIDKSEIQLEKINGFDKLNWITDYKTTEIGNPELPVYRVTYVLPVDAVVTGVTFKRKNKQKLDGSFYLYPVQKPIPTDNSKEVKFTVPNSKVYDSNQPYPNKLYEIETDRFLMGYHIVTLLIYPFEYIPKSRTLNYYVDLDYTIQYTLGGNADEIRPLTQTIRRAKQCKDFVKSIVKNVEDVDIFGSNVLSVREGKKIIQKSGSMKKIKSLSVTDEIVPEYIIITCDSLKSTFQILADWKSKKGVFTIIKTTEEIASAYSGIDLQEKIRKYIIYAYTKWGAGLYVLLGGDTNIVPARMVLGDLTILRPSDRYFASYKGTWNENGDATFLSGESMTPDMGVVLSRTPVKNNTEASVFNKKVISYEKADSISNLNYFNNYLFLDEYLDLSYFNSHIEIQTQNDRTLPDNIIRKYIYDNKDCAITTPNSNRGCANGDIELNKNNFISCLNTGANLIGSNEKFHFIYAMHHCSPFSMGTSSIDKHQNLNRDDVSLLSNGNYYQIFMSSGCEPADFSEDCIAERYLNNPNGGGVAFIGNSDQGSYYDAPQCKYFFEALHKTATNSVIGSYDIGSVYQYVLSQIGNDVRLHLLGDPEMQVWTNTPQTLSVIDTSAVLLGEQNINITINNLPAGQSALVCFQKGSEIYLTATISDTSIHTFTVKSETTGNIDLTITTHNFKPYEKVISVNQTTAPNLFVKSVDFLDNTSPAYGNGNSKNDAGETIQLKASIKNSGINTANNLTAILGVNSSDINILNNQATISSLASGDTTNIYFLYSIDKNTKETLANDTLPIRLNITLQDVNNTIWRDTFNIDIYNDIIRQGNKPIVYISNNHSTIQSGDMVQFNIDLKNIGKAPTKGLKAKITANSAYVQSCNTAWHSYPVINWKEVKPADTPFEFVAGSNILKNLKFNLIVENEYGKQWTDTFSLYKPPIPTRLDFTADSTEINVIWNYSNTYSGYNIYRCDVDSATEVSTNDYIKINTDSITFGYYIDKNLGRLTKYRYRVSGISKSGNEGELSDSLLAWTSLSKRTFPLDCGEIRGGITTADINNDGKKEIFASTKGGYIIGLDYLGTELDNIDGNVTTQGSFGVMKPEAWGTPAISEPTSDGSCVIIGTTRNYAPYQMFCFSNKDKNGPVNNPYFKWQTDLNFINITGSILSNIDNSADGSLESVIIGESGQIATYDSIGNLLNINSSSSNWAPVPIACVADLNGGNKEIIKYGNDGIYIYKNDLSPYNGYDPKFYTFTTNNNVPRPIVICDIDNNGQKEVITTLGNKVYAIRTDTVNKTVAGWQQPVISTTGQISVGDLNHDGKLEIVTLGTNRVTVLNNSGDTIRSLYISNLSPAGTPIIADIDGDSNNEIIFGSSNESNKTIYAFNMDLSKVLGFPLKTAGTAFSVPSVSDINGDGKNEIVLGVGNWIYIWKTNGIAGNVEWGCDRQNQYNTGEYVRNCNSTTIESNETWSSDHDFCGDLIVKSGTLTINSGSNITLSSSSMIIVMSGATLTIDSGKILNCNVKVLSGGTLILKNNGVLDIRSNGELTIEQGAIFENQYGSIE